MSRTPGMTVDDADLWYDGAICPSCVKNRGYSNEMYTDGISELCGYCGTRIEKNPQPIKITNEERLRVNEKAIKDLEEMIEIFKEEIPRMCVERSKHDALVVIGAFNYAILLMKMGSEDEREDNEREIDWKDKRGE